MSIHRPRWVRGSAIQWWLRAELAFRRDNSTTRDNGAVLIKRFRLLGLKWSSWRRKQFRNGDPGLAGHRVEEIRTAIGI
ncbi:MAG: hypothetical protein NTU53_06450, partial [Planctomycetota bacterium]|nr:hypothetical protein [Planctomycetota bacterium]